MPVRGRARYFGPQRFAHSWRAASYLLGVSKQGHLARTGRAGASLAHLNGGRHAVVSTGSATGLAFQLAGPAAASQALTCDLVTTAILVALGSMQHLVKRIESFSGAGSCTTLT